MKSKQRILIAVASFVAVTAIVLFFYIDPNVYPFFPKCPFLVITGFECPGCGSQRAIHQLLHFNISGAFSHNPLVVIYGPYILLGVYLEYLGGKNKFPKIQKFFFGKIAALVILIMIMGFWIARNIF